MHDATVTFTGKDDPRWFGTSASSFMANAMTLGALMELNNAMADADPTAYNERLVRAKQLAEMFARIPAFAYAQFPFSSPAVSFQAWEFVN